MLRPGDRSRRRPGRGDRARSAALLDGIPSLNGRGFIVEAELTARPTSPAKFELKWSIRRTGYYESRVSGNRLTSVAQEFARRHGWQERATSSRGWSGPGRKAPSRRPRYRSDEAVGRGVSRSDPFPPVVPAPQQGNLTGRTPWGRRRLALPPHYFPVEEIPAMTLVNATQGRRAEVRLASPNTPESETTPFPFDGRPPAAKATASLRKAKPPVRQCSFPSILANLTVDGATLPGWKAVRRTDTGTSSMSTRTATSWCRNEEIYGRNSTKRSREGFGRSTRPACSSTTT